MSRRSKLLWISISVLAVALQAAILFVGIPKASNRLGWYYSENQYADGYDELAANLAEGNGYRFFPETARTLTREPGYPFLLAGIFIVFGENFAVVKLLNLLLALAAAYLMMLMARGLFGSRIIILGAPLLFLFHPGTLIAESRGGVEILFAFLLTAFIFTVYRALRTQRWRDFLLSGAMLGVTLLVRSTPILFPLFLLAYLVVFERRRRPVRTVARNIAVMMVAAFLVLSPWIIRNYSLTRKFVPTASVLGIAAQTGFYLATHSSDGKQPVNREAGWERDKLAEELGYQFESGYYQYFYSSADEVNFSNYLTHRVMKKYEQSPLLFLRVLSVNLFNFWCYGKRSKSQAMDAVVQLPLLLLGVIAVALAIKRNDLARIAPMALIILYVVGISIPILAMARYSVPLIPFLAILASIALAEAWRRLRPPETTAKRRAAKRWARVTRGNRIPESS